MFSLPISLPSPTALGRVFSLESWLAHLKCWHHSGRRSEARGAPSQDVKTTLVLPSIPRPLSLNLPSPTVSRPVAGFIFQH